MTIFEALQWANNKLRKADIDSPMLDAEILLASILNITKAKLFSRFTEQLKSHREEQFITSIERRIKREPIAYITNKKEFYKRSFLVNPFVLIPRPATETLIDNALAIAKESNKDTTIFADIGTGSGAIAITLAIETGFPVVASDIEGKALAVAKQNAKQLDTHELIDFRQGDLLQPVSDLFRSLHTSGNPKVSSVYPFKHLILCANLPYLTETQVAYAQKEVAYEPKSALLAGSDGLDAYFRLIKQLRLDRKLLPRRLTVLLEIDPTQKEKITNLIAHNFPQTEPKIKQDLQGLDRIVVAEL